jgi:hypothetical protein
MNYEQKYLKYKQKYLQLKLQLEGGLSLNPWRYKKRESKGTESADLQKFLTERNSVIDEISFFKSKIIEKQQEIKTLEFSERQAFKKQQADEKLEAAKAKVGGGMNIFKRNVVPESEELKGKREELKRLQSHLKELEVKLDNLNKVISAQEKSDHYASKMSKSQPSPPSP